MHLNMLAVPSLSHEYGTANGMTAAGHHGNFNKGGLLV
jgi:hypothetical protein